MKKVISLVLALLILVTCTGCKKGSNLSEITFRQVFEKRNCEIYGESGQVGAEGLTGAYYADSTGGEYVSAVLMIFDSRDSAAYEYTSKLVAMKTQAENDLKAEGSGKDYEYYAAQINERWCVLLQSRHYVLTLTTESKKAAEKLLSEFDV